MKIFFGLLVAAAILVIAAVWQADRIISWHLSNISKTDVKVSGLAIDSKKKALTASAFSVSQKGGPEPVFTAKNIEIRTLPGQERGSSRVLMTDIELGPAIRERMKGWRQWLGQDKEVALSRVDRFDVLFLPDEASGRTFIRVLEVRAPEVTARGGALFEGGRLSKLDLRWSAAPALFSSWPESVQKKMIPDKGGRKAAGIAFGGTTWTLRGKSGPVLQFSGTMAS